MRRCLSRPTFSLAHSSGRQGYCKTGITFKSTLFDENEACHIVLGQAYKDLVIVARATENKEWKEGPVPTMFTSLYTINIRTGEQEQISFPGKNELEEDPQVVGNHLTWFRHKAEQNKGDVWVKNGLNGQEQIWLKNVDYAPTFFTQQQSP